MTSISSRARVFLTRIYLVVALIAATVLSPLALSIIPILLVIACLYTWYRSIGAMIDLLRDYFMFFSVAILLAPAVGSIFSFAISLPVLLLIDNDLQNNGRHLSLRDTKYVRWPTRVLLAMLLIAAASLGLSLALTGLSLLLASAAIMAYLGIRGALVFRAFSSRPVEETPVEQRMVAGSSAQLQIELTTRTTIGGRLFLESTYDWLKVNPGVLPLREGKINVRVSLSPPLAGPSLVKITGHAIDRWGLIQTRFNLEPIRLYVIPRARYAEWLAKKYLTETRPGDLPLVSNVGSLKPIQGLRSGVEYYGSRLYQPGDNLKNMDWKHSFKYGQMITKEFAEFHGRPVVVLINLAVRNDEEADKLAYKIIVTAISLAQNGIPAALAAYDREGVRITTARLEPRQLLLKALTVAKEIVITTDPVRYLDPPDVARLKADISRLRLAKGQASRALLELLQMEYRSLECNSRVNPSSKALALAFAKTDKRSVVLVVSFRNHDSDALAFNTFLLSRTDTSVISV